MGQFSRAIEDVPINSLKPTKGEAIADQMGDASLDQGLRDTVVVASGKPFNPSTIARAPMVPTAGRLSGNVTRSRHRPTTEPAAQQTVRYNDLSNHTPEPV